VFLGYIKSIPEIIKMVIGAELVEVDEIRTVVVDQGVESKSRLPAGGEIVNLDILVSICLSLAPE